jgi:hypothetical protein
MRIVGGYEFYPSTTIDGVRAKEPQIKRIPVIETSQRMP